MFRLGVFSLALLGLGCNDKSFDCADERVGHWAIQFSVSQTDDGECSYRGSVALQDTDDVRDLVCETSGSACQCSGGNEFGTYEVILTNDETEVTERAVITVDAAPSPICLTRGADELFSEVGSGGAGGAGGSAN